MSLKSDLMQVLDIAFRTDPSLRRVEKATLVDIIRNAEHSAEKGETEPFLLTLMHFWAQAGNGHTRVIPNDAISVFPLRFVSIGATVQLVKAAPDVSTLRGTLIAINGTPLSQIEAASKKFLAGTDQRRRVIGPILFVWPFALAHMGFASTGRKTTYLIEDQSGQTEELHFDHRRMVPASRLYPRNEHGKPDPNWRPITYADTQDWGEFGLSISLPSFFDPGEAALVQAMENAADHVKRRPERRVLLDIRGNTGGSFLKTLPLIDALTENPRQQVVLLVDKFTFSAAIVFVAILKHRLGRRLTLIGEEMGDGLTFFAEGGVLELQTSGAAVRYSTAFHDWAKGTTDDTTPPEIARNMVAAGALNLDQEWIEWPANPGKPGRTYRDILKTFSS